LADGGSGLGFPAGRPDRGGHGWGHPASHADVQRRAPQRCDDTVALV